ncbi:MAG TPA: hypothetical protein VN687_12215 [Blastocatellia bacterium]|nr:hypothetical protein [Blastocatellia bacterium]
MSAILDKIKTRGYWRIIIRPTVFRANQLSTLDKAHALVKRSAVSIERRGWVFPQVNLDRDLLRGAQDQWVGQESDWHIHLEAWRMYKSAQFVYLGGFWSDWQDQSIWQRPPETWRPTAQLFVGEVIFKLLETYRFAAGMAAAVPEFHALLIHAKLLGLKDRTLSLGMPGRRWELDTRTLISNSLEYKKTFAREDLLGRTDEIALSVAAEVFGDYKWDPGLEMLRTLRGEYLE